MSAYSARVGVERGGRAASVLSVGETIDVHQVYSSAHPLYKEYSEELRRNLANVIARESEKQSKAQQAVCVVSLPVEDREEVVLEYPEFRILWPQWTVPVHSSWVARRQLINQYMTHHLRKYASSYVHYGGSALSYLTAGITDVTLRVNTTSPVAVHDSFDDDVSCGRLASCAASAATGLGWMTDPAMLRAYAAREILMKDKSVVRSAAVGDALIVDGSLYAMSPTQFAAAMIQHRSEVGMFCLPYHPSMVISPEGVLPGTDVSYELDDTHVKLKYPDGVAGVTSYSTSVWHQWLVNTIRGIDGLDGFSFQYELLGTRGCYMVIRIVKVEGYPPRDVTFVHSLQLDNANDLTLVRTWRLRTLADNVNDERSWEQVVVSVPTRVVQKTHDYAMALDADQFSRHAIRKRLAVTNDRVIVQGTSVEVHDAMRSDQLDVLEIALFTHCFVARYESGRLAADMKRVVDEVAGFGSLSFVSRLSRVIAACASLAYDWSLGAVDDALRAAFDSARRWLGALPKQKGNAFEPAPQFLRYETLVSVKGKSIFDAVHVALSGKVKYSELIPSMPGFEYVSALGAVDAQTSTSVPAIGSEFVVSQNGTEVFSDIQDTALGVDPMPGTVRVVSEIGKLNSMDQNSGTRHYMPVHYNETDVLAQDIDRDDYQYDPGYISTIEDFHNAIVPGMRDVDFKYDPTSISVDDQERSLAADYLDMPLQFGEVPKPVNVYVSRIKTYDVTKRPVVMQETLSAMQARNLSAPVLALPQHDDDLIREIFDDFIDIACLPGARQMLLKYQTDPVGIEEQALNDWASKVRPGISEKVLKYLLDTPEAVEELNVWRYESMIKTDVKPPLSDKPLLQRLEPQLIVHHIGVINAIYSSIFRVLVRRLQSILRPNFMLNLLKDMPQVRDTIQVNHDWDAEMLYLENDFSKYDKSQGQFVHKLEMFMFEQLGMNADFLKQWKLGHMDCSIRSLTAGISLRVRYQRKSGDATTAFGNGMLNIMSVVHAYKGSDIVWGVFMGDDSLVGVRKVVTPELAVRAMAEKFNLQAKFFVTPAPYFASHFILFNKKERRVVAVPDPLKRAQKYAMAISANDPMWMDRYASGYSSMKVYMQRSNLVGLGSAVYMRYGTNGDVDFDMVGDAYASMFRSFEDFRVVWDTEPSLIIF